MKNLENLIKNSVSDSKINNKDPSSEKKSLSEKMFELADEVTNKLDDAKTTKNLKKSSVKNITFSLPVETEELLNDLVKRYMMCTGQLGRKSHIMVAALSIIKDLNDKDFIELVSKYRFN